MELLNKNEIINIAEQCGYFKVLKWKFEVLQDKQISYLENHLNLTIEVECNGTNLPLKLFVKCMPKHVLWKAVYIKELTFFKKEYAMLQKLFKEFENPEGPSKWRPKLLFVKEDTFVFENVLFQGYEMPHYQETFTYEKLAAAIITMARFHVQSYIFEERKSKELGWAYRIWEDYSDYLQEPGCIQDWRDTGRNAVIDYLKVFSKYKSKPNFNENVELILIGLYKKGLELLKPSSEYRNVIVHRDLWTNNILMKKTSNSTYHALFVDFQTVVYCSPMVDMSTLIYMTTVQATRNSWTVKLINLYYTVVSEELALAGINVEDIIDKGNILEAYEKSIVFGLTQAAIVIPITAMDRDKKEEIFYNPERSVAANIVSRSDEFIDIAKVDKKYQMRLTDLFDEIVERFVFPENEISLQN